MVDEFSHIWVEQCEAAREIREHMGRGRRSAISSARSCSITCGSRTRTPRGRRSFQGSPRRSRTYSPLEELRSYFTMTTRVGAAGHVTTEDRVPEHARRRCLRRRRGRRRRRCNPVRARAGASRRRQGLRRSEASGAPRRRRSTPQAARRKADWLGLPTTDEAQAVLPELLSARHHVMPDARLAADASLPTVSLAERSPLRGRAGAELAAPRETQELTLANLRYPQERESNGLPSAGLSLLLLFARGAASTRARATCRG